MWRTIERMRRRSRAARNQMAFVGALGVALVIVGVWSLTVPSRVVTIIEGTETTVVDTRPSLWTGILETPRELFALLRRRTTTQVAAPVAAPPSTPTNPWVSRSVTSSTTATATVRRGPVTPILIGTTTSPTSR